MDTTTSHQIVIVGGNFAGVGVVHHLLKRTIPSLKRLGQTTSYHVTLVTPNTQFFFKIASPRALINSSLIPKEKIVRPLKQAFAGYKSAEFTLLQGLATSIDAESRSITVQSVENADDTKQQHYDTLVIATGTTSESPLWTLHNDETLTWKALDNMNKILPSAKSVIIAGGGPVGVETAGEIASAYPGCKVKLFSGRERLVHHLSQKTSSTAQTFLEQKLNVEVIHNLQVTKVSPEQSEINAEPRATTVTFSDGTKHTADLYISATGGRPNTGFVPKDWLDDTKRIITRDAYFRVRGSQANGSVEGVYAVGDVVSGSLNSSLELDEAVPTVCRSIEIDLAKRLTGVKPDPAANNSTWLQALTSRIFGSRTPQIPTQRECRPWKDTGIIPVGPNLGTGQLNGFQLPSWFVVMAKSKTFLVPMVESMVNGGHWK